jgi:uncharacterized repeat protein (TIGR03803 family)
MVGLDGTYAVLHAFVGGPTDGGVPDAGLIQASDGNFYGTTERGGSSDAGTIFKMTSGGAVTLIHSFEDERHGCQ